MKRTGWILILIGIAFAATRGIDKYFIKMEYSTKVGSNWDLADRASTIAQKSEYIDKFVVALEGENLSGYNSRIFNQTPASDFDENMKALKSLQNRLKEISKMDESAFAYQTAIQQITEQEQGGADEMTEVLSQCWLKKNHYTHYNDIIVIFFVVLQIGLVLVGGIMLMED